MEVDVVVAEGFKARLLVVVNVVVELVVITFVSGDLFVVNFATVVLDN